MTYQDVLGYGGHSSGFVLLPQDVAVTHFGRDGWTGERSISPAVERERGIMTIRLYTKYIMQTFKRGSWRAPNYKVI